MKRIISAGSRISIGNEIRGKALATRVTLSGTTQGILIAPYCAGDEFLHDCKVVEWDANQRICLTLPLCRKAHLAVGDEVDLLFREDGSVLVIPAKDVCSLCGKQSTSMFRLANGRMVCDKCRRQLCKKK